MDRASFFRTADRLPLADITDLLEGGGLVVIAPHADDESLGCGALIATAAEQGIPARIVIVSDGCMSHPNSRRYPRARLRATRRQEARDAAEALGLAARDVAFLDLPDAAVPTEGEAAEGAAVTIASAAAAVGANALFVTWRHDAHCDHKAAYAIARAAQRRLGRVRLFEYSIWGRYPPGEELACEPPAGMRFASSAHRARKQAAIFAHASQASSMIDDDPGGFMIPAQMIADCVARDELFLEMAP
jgi:LmbE family N-acetylglucosaminyl deacetylase